MKIKSKYQLNLNISNLTRIILNTLFDNERNIKIIEKFLEKYKKNYIISKVILKWSFLKKNFQIAKKVELGKNTLNLKI